MDAGYFDQWYSNMVRSPGRGRIVQQALGLPPELESSSLLPWEGVADVLTALQLAPGRLLVDLGRGRGGMAWRWPGGRERGWPESISRPWRSRLRATMPGSSGWRAERIFVWENSSRLAWTRGQRMRSCASMRFSFADPPLAALRECRRILSRGGRLAVTCWEPLDRGTSESGNGCGASISLATSPVPVSSTSRCSPSLPGVSGACDVAGGSQGRPWRRPGHPLPAGRRHAGPRLVRCRAPRLGDRHRASVDEPPTAGCRGRGGVLTGRPCAHMDQPCIGRRISRRFRAGPGRTRSGFFRPGSVSYALCALQVHP